MKIYTWAVVSLLCSGLLLSCGTTIKPAPQAQKVPGLKDAAAATVEGVHMVAQSTEWPGRTPIRQEVTPIRVSIDNNSGHPLQVRYSEFSLVSPQHRLYSALPLYRIKGKVSEFVAPFMGSPTFRYYNFYIAPPLSRAYPGIPPYNGNFYYDPMFEGVYGDYWRNVPLPTSAMWQNGLPEGVLDNGGNLDGWLYFEKVDDDTRHLLLRADLVNAETGRKFGELRIPFVVK